MKHLKRLLICLAIATMMTGLLSTSAFALTNVTQMGVECDGYVLGGSISAATPVTTEPDKAVVSSYEWQDTNGIPLTSGTFQPNVQYYLVVYLRSTSGYTLASLSRPYVTVMNDTVTYFRHTTESWERDLGEVRLYHAMLTLHEDETTVNSLIYTFGKDSLGKSEWTLSGSESTLSGKVTIPSAVGSYPVTKIGKTALQDRTKVTGVTIPDTVKSIGDRAFSACFSLSSVTLPDSLKTIGSGAFGNCRSLKSVTFPSSVYSIGSYAFANCRSLTSIDIPSSVYTVGDYAFAYCNELTNVSISHYVQNFGEHVFDECPKLVSISVDENNTKLASVDGVLFNKAKTTLLHYPVGKTQASYAMPDSVTSIQSSAFYGSKNLTSVTISPNVTTIQDRAFFECDALASITIPANVTAIQDLAFYGCDNLTDVWFEGDAPVIGSEVFPTGATLHYQQGKTGWTSPTWNGYATTMVAAPTYSISFNAGGGTGFMSDVGGVSGTYTLPTCTFNPPAGKRFKAWSVEGVEKAAGDTITVNADVVVTALWKDAPANPETNPGTDTAANTWKQDSKGWRYALGGGKYATNCWKTIGGAWYKFDKAGYMQTGWVQDGGVWYYLKSSGAMATGWTKVGKDWYYLAKSGAMQTGWLKDDGAWYYLKSSGAMATGWIQVGKDWYYLNGSGVMQANKWIGDYYVTASGAMATNTWIGNYHVDASGRWDKTR